MARCLERYFGPRQKADIRYDPYLQRLSQRYVEQGDPVQLNWAILDFGATVCRARNPACGGCVLLDGCKHGKKMARRADQVATAG